MFRLVALALVIGAFAGALYFGGSAMGTWESPKPENVPIPKQREKVKAMRAQRVEHAKPATKAALAKPTWLVELDAACRRGKREVESIPQAATPQEVAPVVRHMIRLNVRLNRETAQLVSRSGNRAVAARLRDLYAQDEALLQRVLDAAEQGRYTRLPALSRSLIAVAKAENTVFARLGARGCTVSPDELQL